MFPPNMPLSVCFKWSIMYYHCITQLLLIYIIFTFYFTPTNKTISIDDDDISVSQMYKKCFVLWIYLINFISVIYLSASLPVVRLYDLLLTLFYNKINIFTLYQNKFLSDFFFCLQWQLLFLYFYFFNTFYDIIMSIKTSLRHSSKRCVFYWLLLGCNVIMLVLLT